MPKFRTLACLSLGLAFAADARAADIIQEPVYAEPRPAPETSGWYLRGDVGYVFKSRNSGEWDFYNVLPGVEGIDDTYDWDKVELKSTASFGAGVGYRFSDQVRVDATLDYFKTDVNGSTPGPFMVQIDPNGLNLPYDAELTYKQTSEAAVWTGLANAYIDLGAFGRVTPYVGAGIGVARVDYDDMTNEQICGAPYSCPMSWTNEGMDSWRFATALTAGASVDITQALKFDGGYRYTRIEGGDAFGYDEPDRAGGATGVQYRDDGFDIHTLRAGLRYEFGGAGFGGSPAPF